MNGLEHKRYMQILDDHFIPDNWTPTAGDILQERVSYISALDAFRPAITKGMTGDDIRNAYRTTNGLLLDFASGLLAERGLGYAPYAAAIVAYVTAGFPAEDYAERAGAFYRKLDEAAAVCEDADVRRLFALEAYYCAGRMLPFESACSRDVHLKTQHYLRAVYTENNIETYCNAVVVAARAAMTSDHRDRFPAAESLLVVSYEDLMREGLGYTKQPAYDVKMLWAQIASTSLALASRLPDDHVIAVRAMPWFTLAVDNMQVQDAALAASILDAGLKTCREPYAMNKTLHELLQAKAVMLNAARSLNDRPESASSEVAGANRPPLAQPR